MARADFQAVARDPLRASSALLAMAFAAALALPAGAAPTNAPRITAASVSPSRFAVDRTGPPEVQAGLVRGTTFSYELSKQADVFFFLDRATRGRTVGGHCRRGTRANHRHRACTLYVRSGSFKQAGVQGTNAKSFSGRIGRLTLRPANYRAKLVAVDAMGNPSTPGVVVRFTILPG